MSQTMVAVDPATDPNIDPQIRSFLKELNKDTSPIWEKPGPEVRATLTALQAQTPVDVSGITITEKIISENDRKVKLYIVKPEKVQGTPPVILFIHGGVWLAGNFENHKRLVRDVAVGTGAAAVFPEYTPIPDAIFPTQIEENYAAAKWVAAHGGEIGVDGSRMAVVGNSVGGNMSTVVAMMAKENGGPKIKFQVLLIPATDTNFDTESYRDFATGRFLARDEGEAYARKLKDAGVEVTATRYNGMIHDFVLLNGINQVAGVQAALRQTCDEIKKRLNS